MWWQTGCVLTTDLHGGYLMHDGGGEVFINTVWMCQAGGTDGAIRHSEGEIKQVIWFCRKAERGYGCQVEATFAGWSGEKKKKEFCVATSEGISRRLRLFPLVGWWKELFTQCGVARLGCCVFDLRDIWSHLRKKGTQKRGLVIWSRRSLFFFQQCCQVRLKHMREERERWRSSAAE